MESDANSLSEIKSIDNNARLGFIPDGAITESVIATAKSLKTESNEVFVNAMYKSKNNTIYLNTISLLFFILIQCCQVLT